MTEYPSVADRVEEWGIFRADATLLYTGENASKEYPEGSHAWRVTLAMGEKRMDVEYHMGALYKDQTPEVEDVLDSLRSESTGVSDGETFEDWASEYEADPDSRKAEALFNEMREQAERLREFLGEDSFKELLYETEGM